MIEELKSLWQTQERIIKQPELVDPEAEFDLFQELDQRGIYLKKIIRDSHCLFRAFADALTFSQAQFSTFKRRLIRYFHRNQNVSSQSLTAQQVNRLLSKFPSCPASDSEDYIS